ncbi:TetR/AcrR family transcriptional regulator [Agrobacterium pusense]|uniref:TetR/AcrR family transcriptional regulator n=1 Tax=Agrobacterium pusense TaxID=648995 RepID=UPI0010BF1D74|nr:TetR/AcrR family transcriptional regulator [Agrobacterium pusense]MDH0115626.1 TetR/AcrR family transcriptional regulator [Agrobacterium pusense]QCL86731.1 TetR/AcrR family transcriptional regulator [Agrobacterium pusense]
MSQIPSNKTGKTGRKRDSELDEALLDATIEVLSESGFAGMTMDMVAAKAGAGKASVYRRWQSKVDLVQTAIERLSIRSAVLTTPDTGSLREDLLALLTPDSDVDGERLLRVMLAIASVPDAASIAQAASARPWVAINAQLIERAIARGEISSSIDVELMSQVLPSLVAYRVAIERKPINAAFIASAIDSVLLPALLGAGFTEDPKKL